MNCLSLYRYIFMKKFFAFTFLAAIVAITIPSCKSHERCPAYGKVEQSQKKSL